MLAPTKIYLRPVENRADLIHFPERRKTQLIQTKMRDQSDSIAGKVLDLHLASLGSMPRTPEHTRNDS